MTEVRIEFVAEPKPRYEAGCGAVYATGETPCEALQALADKLKDRYEADKAAAAGRLARQQARGAV